MTLRGMSGMMVGTPPRAAVVGGYGGEGRIPLMVEACGG